MLRLRRPLALLVAAVATLSCARVQQAPAPQTTVTAAPFGYVYPGAEWERVPSPESVGWSSAGLDSVRALLETLPMPQ